MQLKRIGCVLLALLLCLSFSGCGRPEVSYEARDYVLELPYEDDFRILLLPDVHVGNKDDRQRQYDFLDLTIRDADADLILLTGDLFTFADKITAKELFAFLDGYGIPWTVAFGNHDEQCYFSIDWLTGLLNDYGSNCVFRDLQDDDVFGNSNFAIDLMRDGKVFEQLIVMDSNRYTCGDYWGYDYIKQDQIDWYERIVRDTAESNGGETVDSLLFFHIPLPEFNDAWDGVETGESELIYGNKNEKVCCPEYNSGLFDRVLALDSTRGIFVGHDHLNDFCVKYKDVIFSYGITATDRIYYKDGQIGGSVVVIAPDHSLSFDHVLHSYSEVAS